MKMEEESLEVEPLEEKEKESESQTTKRKETKELMNEAKEEPAKEAKRGIETPQRSRETTQTAAKAIPKGASKELSKASSI